MFKQESNVFDTNMARQDTPNRKVFSAFFITETSELLT